MEEYRVDMKVRNNIILKKIEHAGYKTIGELCRLNNCMHMVSRMCEVVNMKMSPLNKDGSFNLSVRKIAEIVGCAPEDLFTDVQLHTELKTNKRSLQINEAEMRFMLENEDNTKLLEDQYHEDKLTNKIEDLLNTLTPREKSVIEMRMGLGEYRNEHTLDQVAEFQNVTRERIRQIEAKALRKMRHPLRSDPLREYIHSGE